MFVAPWEPRHLPNLPFKVLLYLIEHRDRVVTRQELFDAFWDGRDVYDDTSSRHTLRSV